METQSHFRHYMIVAVGIVTYLGVAITFSCAGIFFPYVTADLGIGLGQMSLYLTIALLTSFFTMPVLGRLVGKVPMKILMTITTCCFGGGLLIFSQASNVFFFYVGGVLLGVAMGFNGSVAVPTLLNRWFTDRAGFFLGICAAMTGIGGVIFNAVGGAVINAAGWQMGYMAFGVILLVMCLPLILLFVADSPEAVGLKPHASKKAQENAGDASAAAAKPKGISAGDAKKFPAFWAIMGLYALTGIGVQAYQFFPSYATSLPVATAALGATLASVVMAAQAIGKIALGGVCDKSPALGLLGPIVCGIAGVAILWLMPINEIMIYCGGALFGIYYAVQNVVLPQMNRMVFGTRDYAKILSTVAPVSSLCGAFGASAWGFLIDATGFQMIFVFSIVFMVVAIICGLVVLKSREKANAQWTEE